MTTQFITYPSATGGGVAGVSSLNGQTGALTLLAGSNITITPGAGTLTIAASGTGGGDLNNGGNAFGSAITMGTTDAFSTSIIANGVTGLTLDTSNNTTIIGTLKLTDSANLLSIVPAVHAANRTLTLDMGGSFSLIMNAALTVSATANVSGTNSGNVTLAAVGAVPNANAASLSGQALNLQPFSSTFPGVVTASGGGTSNFLRADGTWASPGSGSGDINNGGNAFGSAITIGTTDGFTTSIIANNTIGLTVDIDTPNVSTKVFGLLKLKDNVHGGFVILNADTSTGVDKTLTFQMINGATLTMTANLDVQGSSVINGSFIGGSSGTNTGDVTLTAVGATPNANAASISGQALNLQPFSSSFPGVVTASGGGTTNFLRADGTWATPGGGGSGDVVGPASATNNAIALFDTTTGKLIKNSTVIVFSSQINTLDQALMLGNGTYDNFAQVTTIHNQSLTASSTTQFTPFSFQGRTGFKGIQAVYVVKNGNDQRFGTLTVVCNGTTTGGSVTAANIIDEYTESTSDVNLSWSVAVSGDNINVSYTTSSGTYAINAVITSLQPQFTF